MHTGNKTKTAIFIVLIMVCMGEINEIEYQYVAFGEYIKQYAMVRVITGSDSVRIPCPDCVSYLTVYDSNRMKPIDYKPMEILDSKVGLWGYRLSSSELSYNTTYDVVFTTISPTYGNGSVPSQIYVTDHASTLSTMGGTSASYVGEELVDAIVTPISDKINSLADSFNPLKIIVGSDNYDNLVSALNTITSPFTSFLGYVGSFIWYLMDFMTYSISSFVLLLNSDTRDEGFQRFVDFYYQTFLEPLMYVLLPLIVVYELFAVSMALTKRTGIEKMMEFARMHQIALEFIIRIMDFIAKLIQMAVNFVFSFIEAIPFIE